VAGAGNPEKSMGEKGCSPASRGYRAAGFAASKSVRTARAALLERVAPRSPDSSGAVRGWNQPTGWGESRASGEKARKKRGGRTRCVRPPLITSATAGEGTGGTAGTYYPVGGLIANAISNPPGSRACNEGGSCGVPGLVASAVASNGSVANINAIGGGSMESGFTQSDVAYWAYTGTGVYEGKTKVPQLRLIANLYPESIHLVARKGSGIKGVADLRGKRVSLDEPGSGTLVDARIIMGAFGITEKDIKPEYLKPNQAGDKLRDGGLDAFFFVGGYPAGAIAELAASGAGIELVPITGPEIDKMRGQYGFFQNDTIPANTYKGVNEVRTLAVGAQ